MPHKPIRLLFITLLFLFLPLISSCEYNQPVREYFEYWSSTCQVGKIEYASECVYLNEVPNLSAKDFIEINLYTVNPKEFTLLCKEHSFSFHSDSGNLDVSDYEQIFVDPTQVKIRAKFTDASEGDTITFSGCLWPENRASFTGEQLEELSPELFYTTSFVQNTPPDNVKNLNSSGEGDFYTGTQKHYLSFDLPDLEPKRNKGSRYEIKCYLREGDGLQYIGSEILTLDENDPGKRTYLYYYADQDDYLFYEYTVQVLGPHGLKAELLATDERLGVHQLTEPTITILDELNGLEDEQGFKCVEVATNDGTVSYTAQAANEGDILTVTVDDGNGAYAVSPGADGNYTISGIGQYTITAKSRKDGSRPISVTKKIRIVKTPDEATFTFGTNGTSTYFNDMTDGNGFEYLEVPLAGSKVSYSISPTEAGTSVTGTSDSVAFDGLKTGELSVGSHTLVAVIHKQYCKDVTTTRKIMVAKTLENPVYTFEPDLNDKTVGDVEYIEVASSSAKAGYTVKPSTADGDAKVSGSVGSTTFAATTQKSGELSVGDYTFAITVSKDHMISRTFTRKIKVDSKLSAPSITFTPSYNGKSETSAGNNYEYIEVADSSSKVTYTVTNTDSREGTSVSTIVTNMANNSTVTGTQLGVGRYRITATVSKDGYTDVSATKYIVIVPKLKEPDITFGKSFNEEGVGSDGYLYIEVPYTSSLVSYTASSTESDVTVTTTNRGASINNSGNLSIGTYDIEVTASKDYHNDVSITKKVKVVQEIQEPTCVFTPGLTSESSYAWVEVPSTNHTVSCKVTANASGEKIKVTEGGTSLYNTGSSPATFTLSTLGDHTLTIVVTKDNYKPKTFTKTVKIVEELQEPTLRFYKHDGNDVLSASSSAPEQSGYSDYTCYDIDLASDGTGYLYYTATSPDSATVTIKDDGSTNTTGKLAIGPHKLVATVSKTNYKTKTFSSSEKKVYVQGILSAPTFTPDGTKIKTDDDGTEHWQYSYITYDEMPINITPGNTGNTLEIHDETQIVTSASIGYNTAASFTVVQSREYCKSRTDESKWMSVTIKPITLKYSNKTGTGKLGKLELKLSNFGNDPRIMPLGANIVISKTGGEGKTAYNKTGDSVDQDTWLTLNDSTERNVAITLTDPSDVINVYTDIWRTDKSNCTMNGHTSTRTLYQVKHGMGESGNASSWTFIVDMYAGYYSRCAQPRIQFDVSD